MNRYLIRLAICAVSAVVLAIAKPASPARAAEPQAGIDVEVVYRALYPGLKRHKALAVGPSGVWGYGSGYRSAAEAEKSALKNCLTYARSQSWGKGAKCQLFAKNDKIVWSKGFMGVSLDKALPLPDVPLQRAVRYWPQDRKLKGVILALHGCSDPGPRVPSFADTWFRFFQARGFLVVYPSSFDEARPSEVCTWSTPQNYQFATEAAKFRVAQAKRTIAELRKAYPRLPLYIWAFSRGGMVAQILDVKVSGIVIVGSRCGVSYPEAVLVPRSVPILHVFGALDDLVAVGYKTLTTKSINKLCGPRYRGKTRSWVIAEGAGHLTTLWRQNVIDAASRLIGQKSFNLAESTEPLTLEGEARTAYERVYQKSRKTAFAIGPGGKYGIAASWTNVEDTKQDALYQCARAVNRLLPRVSYPPGGSQPCRLYAIGGKVVAK